MEIHENVSLAEYTTLRLGGVARFFISVNSLEELREALTYAREHGLQVFVLGGGSNTLFSDDGWTGVVIHIALRGRDYTEDNKGDAQVIAMAGEVWDDLVADSVAQGFWGMENLSLIPGTVGATPVQNVGAYGASIGDIVDWVEVLDRDDLSLHILAAEECCFGYRDSIFKRAEGARYIVTRVAYRLSTHAQPRLEYKDLIEYFEGRTDVTVAEVRDAVCEIRRRKFPDLKVIGTAGSFFKNPVISDALLPSLHEWFGQEVPHYATSEAGKVKIPAAWLLEHLDWKGRQVGHMGCWKDQPLVLVHYGEGDASELILFAHRIMQEVKDRTTIKLDPEVCIVAPQACSV